MKGRIDNCQMITIESLDLRDGEIETNLKSIELEKEEVKLFDKSNP